MRTAAYVFAGWHPIAEREPAHGPEWTEWELVQECRPRFEGHRQPRVPLLGPYDDRDPVAMGRRIGLAAAYGVDALVVGFFWCRGKRVFEEGLTQGVLGSREGQALEVGLMWANRLPRHVLPVRRADLPVIAGDRLVHSDEEDFVALVDHLSRAHFDRPNYLRVEGRLYLSIFDPTHFVRELGAEGARRAIAAARRLLAERGQPDLHLVAIDPAPELQPVARDLGFDAVTHYVLLPEWKGPSLQDYRACATARAGQWAGFLDATGLPYAPSVAPGWDASPRAADFGPERPGKYPWSPVVTGEHPEHFADAVARARAFVAASQVEDPLLMVASLNEWSEGHYLEPDERFGHGWLEALRGAL
jgi:nucleotide-binding universal stress UspA family protein